MYISKEEVVDLLIGVAMERRESLDLMESAIRRKTKIWGPFEWARIKDMELCIKALYREFKKGEFPEFNNLKQILIYEAEQFETINDPWALERIHDCRDHLSNLDFP